MSLVLDASITTAWLNEEETTSGVTNVFDRLAVQAAWVPSLWWLEVANSLHMGLKRKRFTREQRDRYLEGLSRLTVQTDRVPIERTWRFANDLASVHGLTVYDAVYLELALRLDLPLATLDRQLRAAAAAESVMLLGH